MSLGSGWHLPPWRCFLPPAAVRRSGVANHRLLHVNHDRGWSRGQQRRSADCTTARRDDEVGGLCAQARTPNFPDPPYQSDELNKLGYTKFSPQMIKADNACHAVAVAAGAVES